MPLPIHHLPVIQNWDCHACGTCCHEYQVTVTDAERKRIVDQKWNEDAEIGAAPIFSESGPPWNRQFHLSQKKDGACVFLKSDGRCRIHERYGASAKPLACQIYPFILVPVAGAWRIGLRFSCPSTAASRGRPLTAHQPELKRFAAALEALANGDANEPPHLVRAGGRLTWPNTLALESAVLDLLQHGSRPIERRLRTVVALSRLCREARLNRLDGSPLREFLELASNAVVEETPADPMTLARPSGIGRVLFRQLAGIYARRDSGPQRGENLGRLALLRAAWRFARGRGKVPRVHGWMADRSFNQLEEPSGPLPAESNELLQRYYAIKISSFQFCGPAHFGFDFWDGIESLALTYPVVMWLARCQEGDRALAISRAVSMVDHNWGYHPLLGTSRQKASLRILSGRGEIERLIGWYSR